MGGAGEGTGGSAIDGLIHELFSSGRAATDDEIRRIRARVAQAGFDPDAREQARGIGAGIIWKGRVLKGNDRLSPAEVHYIRHVLGVPEWPAGTTLQDYQDSTRNAVDDDDGGVFLSQYSGEIQVGFVSRAARWRGARGKTWILVEYRVGRGRWMTAHQIEPELLDQQPQRSKIRWLRQPK